MAKESKLSLKMEVVINAEGAVVGRLATYAAKQALMGNKVTIVNCGNAIITGKKHALIEIYQNKRLRGGTSQKGPYYSRNSERIVKRAIRGMLPWKFTRGKEAFKKVMCYTGIPEEYSKKDMLEFKKDLRTPYMTVAQISELM